jgi:hypothetical protein
MRCACETVKQLPCKNMALRYSSFCNRHQTCRTNTSPDMHPLDTETTKQTLGQLFTVIERVSFWHDQIFNLTPSVNLRANNNVVLKSTYSRSNSFMVKLGQRSAVIQYFNNPDWSVQLDEFLNDETNYNQTPKYPT